ncbi:MAG: hypothetical protein NT139_02745 [Candidatus Woesearchaeota archaeon]|nr:hypothetical protein [Candidatus Woesearchaeota archaeon]
MNNQNDNTKYVPHQKKEDNLDIFNTLHSLDIFNTLHSEKIDSIKDTLKEIELLIQQREQLTLDLFKDIDKVKTSIDNIVLQLGNQTNLKEQMMLKQKQIEIEEFRLQEKVNAWRDIALLKKELRDRVKEVKDRESRVDILDKILEEDVL